MNYKQVFTIPRLWAIFIVFLTAMFGALLFVGGISFREAPPVPESVIVENSDPPNIIFTSDQIHQGRDIWRRLGGMELGSVWGHGAYLAPDWTADVLHR